MDTGPRTGIAYTADTGSDGTDSFRHSIRNIAAWAEAQGAEWVEDTLANRPAAGKHGRFFKDTGALGNGVIYYDNGATWEAVGSTPPTDAAANVGSLRTLGAGSLQAAAGNHAHGGGQMSGQDFTSSGTWTCPTGVTGVSVLLVGGGGAGGATSNAPGGGGGGGQVVYKTVTVVPGTAYTITIGAGGTGVFQDAGGSGGTSSFGALVTAAGGGGGNSGVGASGGGGFGAPTGAGGGGGGAGGPGGNAKYIGNSYAANGAGGTGAAGGGGGWGGNGPSAGGDGGLGLYGFGGGGGGGAGSGFAGAGSGSTGGGAGANSAANGAAAAVNTGSGGGGAGGAATGRTGGNGGSGFCRLEWIQ